MKPKISYLGGLLIILISFFAIGSLNSYGQTLGTQIEVQGSIGGTTTESSISDDSFETVKELPKTAGKKQDVVLLKRIPTLGEKMYNIILLLVLILGIILILWRWKKLNEN